MAPVKLVCLLPVRNGEADLPDYFASVRRFADAVVALDDGSTDATRELLAAEPLVTLLLDNPRRADYRGWNEAADRARLLAAAAALAPDWIISLDADERLDPGDARALRAFIEEEDLPGYAYGLHVHRMVHDLGQYDRAGLVVFRLFAFAPGQRFPDRRLHMIPVPTAIPRRRWLETTLRIQHVASLTEERRLTRFEKYRQVDPDHTYQSSYVNLLAAPGELKPWRTRSPGTPVLASPGKLVALPESDAALAGPRPVLSAIIIARDEEARIARAVASVVGQACPHPVEVIVVTSGTDRTAAIVRAHFPTVTLVELPDPALPGEARNAGLHVPRETIDRCIEYVKRSQNPDGGFMYMLTGGDSAFPRSAAGVVALYSAGIYEGPELSKGLEYLMHHLPRGDAFSRETHYFYGHYYAVQAMWHAGGQHWNSWYPAIRDELVSRQHADGSWMDSICVEYGTAMACIVLQMPNNYLPIFQR